MSPLLVISVLFINLEFSFGRPEIFVGFGNGSASAEFLDFPSSGFGSFCEVHIPEYPLGEMWGTVGLVVDGKVVLCGGVNFDFLDWR